MSDEQTLSMPSKEPPAPRTWSASGDWGRTDVTIDGRFITVWIADDDLQRNYQIGCPLTDYATYVAGPGWTPLRQIVASDFGTESAEIEAYIAECLRP